ncbi:MAG: ADP-ribosylglycohydrolase family protein, partial [Thermomicrobiales bacterium]
VSAVDHHGRNAVEPFRVMQDSGTGLLIHGTREWTDYTVGAAVRPQLVQAAGIAARVQGLHRYYALVLAHDGRLKLLKALDGLHVLAETEWPWQPDVSCQLELSVHGREIRARVDGQQVFAVEDSERPLTEGAIALVCEEGRLDVDEVWVRPLGHG